MQPARLAARLTGPQPARSLVPTGPVEGRLANRAGCRPGWQPARLRAGWPTGPVEARLHPPLVHCISIVFEMYLNCIGIIFKMHLECTSGSK